MRVKSKYRCEGKGHGIDFGFCEECFRKQLVIDGLKEENERLKAQLRYRKKKDNRPFSGVFGSSTPSSKIEIKANTEEEKQAKQGGAQAGHTGHGRTLFKGEEADERISLRVEMSHCPDCGGKLESKGIDERQIIDAFLTEARKVIYACQLKRCQCCKKEVSRRPLVLPGSKYGNGLLSNAIVMHYLEGIPLSQVSQLYGIKRGALIRIFHKLADQFSPSIETLTEAYRDSAVKHADETGWRTNGKNGYAWLFCTDELSLFRFGESREGRIAREVLGETPKGILIVDRYGGYNKVSCPIQYCYAHLLRDLCDLEKKDPESTEIRTFVSALAPLFAKAMGLRRTAISDADYLTQAQEIRTQLVAHCRAPAQKFAIHSFQRLILDQEHRLFHWVTDRSIPPDNNRAERELRPTVIARKNSFGSQSLKGAKTRSVLMSVLHTVAKRLQTQSIRLWVQSVLETLAKNPNADLYPLILNPDPVSVPASAPVP